jgi:phosphonate transport system substrate-binding protein
MVKTGMVALVVLMALGWFRPGTASAEIKLGLLPRLSATEMTTMFTPLAEYLSKETGEKVSLVIPKDFDAFKALMASGQADMGFANPLVYVQLKKNDASLDLLGLSSEKSGTKFRGIIIARKDSGIEKVQDLKGKKLIFVEEDSAAGHIFQMLTLSKAGLDVKKDFTKLPFARKHTNVALAVSIRRRTQGLKMISKDERGRGSCAANCCHTDYYPNWPVFSTKRINRPRRR